MREMSQSKITPERLADSEHLPYVAVLKMEPGLADPDSARRNFETQLLMNPKALVLLGYATGAIPDALLPHIASCKEKGIPVFILSDNYHNQTGVQEISYDSQQKAVDAGAIFLKDINVNSLLDLVSVVQSTIKQGLTGAALKDAISAQFGEAS